MAQLNVFENDAFGVTQLTASISQTPHVPGRIGALGLFQEEGITTTSAFIELQGETLSLVPASSRGAPGTNVSGDKRQAVPVSTLHLAQSATILADEVQNVRVFGSETEVQTVQTLVTSRLAKMRRRLDATIEYQRIGALRGQILDADGETILLDLFSLLGLKKSTLKMALTSDTTKVLGKILSAKRMGEDNLGGAYATGWRALCSGDYFDAFTEHGDVKEAFNFYNAQVKSKDNRSGFSFGDVTWEEYRGKVGGKFFIPQGKALLVPEGVPDMFITNYAPADYMETANTIGLPYYAKQEALRMNKGVELEAQSNPISYSTRPTAVIELDVAS